MHHKMRQTVGNIIKNWRLSLLALIFISFFSGLGTWQLSRAKQKEGLLTIFDERMKTKPLFASHLQHQSDWRFYRAELIGSFDNEHTLLLDNKTFKGQVGYEIYTPFKAEGLPFPVLVDRGFVPLGKSRANLPNITPIVGKTNITGLFNLPPAYVALGNLYEATELHWPLRVQYLNLAELKELLSYPLLPYILTLTPNTSPYVTEWRVVITGPERHRGYALQWFALALTLLILFVVLNGRPHKR